MLEIIEEAKSEDRKIIVFSFYLDTIKEDIQIYWESSVWNRLMALFHHLKTGGVK